MNSETDRLGGGWGKYNQKSSMTETAIDLLAIQRVQFLEDINTELYPILQVIKGNRDNTPSLDIYNVVLRGTPYAMTDQVVITDKMDELVIKLGKKYFGQEPRFNNTHRIFWFTKRA